MKLFKQKGFTLIELLVVIGILGILASALVATIDPFEQLKKANDSNVKNTLVEYTNGTIRYYTTHNTFPWRDDAPATDCNMNGAGRTITTVPLSDGTTADACVDTLISDKELKPGFGTAHSILKEIYISYDDNTNEVIACFMPQSKSQQNDVNTKYNATGVVNAEKDCTVTTNPAKLTNGCWWCTR